MLVYQITIQSKRLYKEKERSLVFLTSSYGRGKFFYITKKHILEKEEQGQYLKITVLPEAFDNYEMNLFEILDTWGIKYEEVHFSEEELYNGK